MGVYVHDNNWATRRAIVIGGLIVFHLLLFWGLKSGFAMKMVQAVAPPIIADIIKEVKEEDVPPPPPPPKMEMPPVEVPPPVVDITLPTEAPVNTISNVTDRPRPPPPPPAPPPPAPKPQLKLNARANQPNMDDYYPPASQRLGEEGVTRVHICVGTNGRVTDAKLDGTSGFPRLDEAAVKVAKLYRFDAISEEVCNVLPVRFKLKN
ncbi:MAG: energy transducer TonB [Steroidobacteraceae bacterium]